MGLNHIRVRGKVLITTLVDVFLTHIHPLNGANLRNTPGATVTTSETPNNFRDKTTPNRMTVPLSTVNFEITEKVEKEVVKNSENKIYQILGIKTLVVTIGLVIVFIIIPITRLLLLLNGEEYFMNS